MNIFHLLSKIPKKQSLPGIITPKTTSEDFVKMVSLIATLMLSTTAYSNEYVERIYQNCEDTFEYIHLVEICKEKLTRIRDAKACSEFGYTNFQELCLTGQFTDVGARKCNSLDNLYKIESCLKESPYN